MAEKIVQRIGLDAGNTLATLSSLEAGFAKLNASLNTSATGIKRFNTASTGAGRALDKTNKSTKSFVITWQTLSRVLMTQAIVRSLNAVRDALDYAYKSQMEFVKGLSEIKAIDPDRSFNEIAEDVRKLSDAFSQPIGVVAEAQYEAMSDQFTTAAERADILSAANSLAKTTEDDLVGATQLLTGALNAYGESSEMAGLRAAQFFESINLGRFRATELGAALSRIQSIGAELGVSMEELQAGLISITIGGVKAREASTQLRGIFTALLKPSEAMKKALKDIGVESGPAAIRTFGLAGALQALKDTTDGSSTAVSQLIPRVRGAAGAFRLLGKGAQAFAEAEEKLQESDKALLSGKALEAMSTDAARLTLELNKLRNFFTAELGADMVATANSLINVFGGGKGLVGILRTITSEAPAAAAAVGGLILSLRLIGPAAAAGFAQFGMGVNLGIAQIATLRNALGLLMAWHAARIIGKQIGTMISEELSRSETIARETLTRSIEMNKARTAASIREKNRENKALMQLLRQHLLGANRLHIQNADNFKLASKIQVKAMGRAFDNILSDYKSLIQKLGSLSDSMAKKAAGSYAKISGIEDAIWLREKLFEVKKLPLTWQVRKLSDALHSATSDATALQKVALGAEQQKAADAAWQTVDALKQALMSTVQQTDSIHAQEKALKDLRRSDEARIGSIERQAKLQKAASVALARQHHEETKYYEAFVRQREVIAAKISKWTEDEQGALIIKHPEQARKDLGEARALIDEWVGAVQARFKGAFLKDFMGDASALTALKREAEAALGSLYFEDLQMAPESVARMWDDLRASAAKVRLEFKGVVIMEELTGMTIEQHGLDAVMRSASEISKGLTEQAKKRAQYERNATEARKEFQRALAPVSEKVFDPTHEVGMFYTAAELKTSVEARASYAAFTQQMVLLSRQSKITREDMLKLGEAAMPLADPTMLKAAFPGRDAGYRGAQLLGQLESMMKALKALQAAQSQMQATGQVDQKTIQLNQQLQRALQLLQQKKAIQDQGAAAVGREASAVQSVSTAIGGQIAMSGSAVGAADAVAASWMRVASAARTAAAAVASVASGGSVEAQMVASGGSIRRFDSGGTARGTDRISAMLSPGEFVMNAKSARQWYPQLLAMNAGIKPSKEQGGTNTSAGIIGDVTVNVNGGTKQVGREIVAVLNREIRRGSSRLK